MDFLFKISLLLLVLFHLLNDLVVVFGKLLEFVVTVDDFLLLNFDCLLELVEFITQLEVVFC
jgi:hypothetical protein